jgi:large subunit ribosomal protein L10
MQMHKSEKEAAIKQLNEKFVRAKSAVLAEFSKLDVAAVTQLRKKCREGGVEYRVIKNTLAKRAAKGTPMESLSAEFSGPVALALGYADVVAPAKILTDFAKGVESIRVRGGMLDGQKLDAQGVKAFAKMPGLHELRGQIAGLLMQPASRLVRTIGAPAAQLARVLQARQEALAKQG